MHNSASYSPILMLQSIYIMGNVSPDMLQKFRKKKLALVSQYCITISSVYACRTPTLCIKRPSYDVSFIAMVLLVQF